VSAALRSLAVRLVAAAGESIGITGSNSSGTLGSRGIVRSVRDDKSDLPTVNAVLLCLFVSIRADYGKLCDYGDHAIDDSYLKLTAGRRGRVSPDYLPGGFLVDRQRSQRRAETLTDYLNHDVMAGLDAVPDAWDARKTLPEKPPGAESLGFELVARPDGGFMR
jgi:hypothetical protein